MSRLLIIKEGMKMSTEDTRIGLEIIRSIAGGTGILISVVSLMVLPAYYLGLWAVPIVVGEAFAVAGLAHHYLCKLDRK